VSPYLFATLKHNKTIEEAKSLTLLIEKNWIIYGSAIFNSHFRIEEPLLRVIYFERYGVDVRLNIYAVLVCFLRKKILL